MGEVKLIQLLLAAFAAGMMVLTWLKSRHARLRPLAFLLWLLVWSVVLLVVLFPDLTSMAAGYLGMGRGVDLVLYVGMLYIYFLLFTIQEKIGQIERDLSTIVREMAFMAKERGGTQWIFRNPAGATDDRPFQAVDAQP